MTRKQMALVIAINAVISTVISVIVVLLIVRPTQIKPTPTAPAGTPATTQQPLGQGTESPEQVVHIVQNGDTISALSLLYDVAGEDIIAANNLENPNYLQVGMELIIPIGGLAEATATFTPAPTPTDTPIPFEPPSADMTATAAAAAGATVEAFPTTPPEVGESQIEISEVLAIGDVTEERVVILNNGNQLADMQGWMLSDSNGNVYTFPNFRLWGAGSVTVHSRVGTDGSPPANFYWGKLEPVWSLGEVVTLKNAQGEVISTLTAGP